jgi:hypothetical protein
MNVSNYFLKLAGAYLKKATVRVNKKLCLYIKCFRLFYLKFIKTLKKEQGYWNKKKKQGNIWLYRRALTQTIDLLFINHNFSLDHVETKKKAFLSFENKKWANI